MFLLALGASPALGSPAAGHAPPEMSLDKVLVVGTDGTRWDLLEAAMKSGRAPNLARLGREGFARPSLLEYGPEVLTLSEVGWSSIASGVWPDKHGVDGSKLNMDPRQATKNGYRDFLTRIENDASDFDTYLASDWANIGLAENGGPDLREPRGRALHDRRGEETLAAWNAGDVEVTECAERFLRTRQPRRELRVPRPGGRDRAPGGLGPARLRDCHRDHRWAHRPDSSAPSARARAIRSRTGRSSSPPTTAKGRSTSRRWSATSARRHSRSPRS